MEKRWQFHPITSTLNNHLVDLPSASNLSLYLNFGSLAGVILGFQLITGVFLAMHLTAHVDLAFDSVEHIMRDVYNGWFMRLIHAYGASVFLTVLLLHMARGLLLSSFAYPRAHVWQSGVTLFILVMGTAFMGLVLPLGQISMWGATVITRLISVIPQIGDDVVRLVWGGLSVANPTLNRFLSIHLLLPFVVAALAVLHLILTHVKGSTYPLGVDERMNVAPFLPLLAIKDTYGLLGLLIILFVLVFLLPYLLGHPDNLVPANPLVTPAHIVPEWLFLIFLAILRSIPHKLIGVVAMVRALLLLLALPAVYSGQVRRASFRPLFRPLFWLFVGNAIILSWIGQYQVEFPLIEVGQVATILLFVWLIFGVGLLGRFENLLAGFYRY